MLAGGELVEAGLTLAGPGAVALQLRVELGQPQGDLGLLLAQVGLPLLGGPSQGGELQVAGGGGAQLELPYLGASALYFSALRAWRLRDSSCLPSSWTMSATRSRFCWVASIFRSAASRRCLYLVMPAASSMTARRSSGRAETIWPMRPCSMME